MFFQWLKQYMPRSLYGRAALILIVPVVTLQLGVSLVFIQRHFEDVTVQLTNGLILEFQLLQETADGANNQGEALIVVDKIATPLRLNASYSDSETIPSQNFRRFIDITGGTVIRSLTDGIPNIGPILLPNDHEVTVFLPTKWGDLNVSFARNRVSANNPHQLLVWTIGLGLFMVIIAFIFLRNQLRPIKRLSHAAEAFGKGHHLPYRPSGAYEVRSAGNAFLEMRARIERHIEQRTLMLSGVSHDLRSPLTRLKLALSMSDDPSANGMRKDVEDMQRLLDEFLTFARRDADSASDVESVNSSELIGNIVDGYATRGEPVLLHETIGEGTLQLRPTAIRRAIENLIDNALNYGSCAEISVVHRKKSVTISIEDSGAGIPESQRIEALKPFARLDPARNQNIATGVGLGLSIAADVARAHGGQLRLDTSERLGGLKADLILPIG
ncbi:MAG: ATP-binding protein [Paracoccaceae bacterium]|nr:ATP-binding protein [Paracoccaceae bacterium]MDG2259182.1 ATP-binding protein [Paracoccaceae bacterium]